MRARQNSILKGLAFVVAVVSFATAAMLGCYQLANVDVIWGQSSAAEGYTIRYMQQQDAGNISYLVDLYYLEQENGALNSYDQQSLSDLKEKYAKENTNLRWQLMDPEGNVLYGNWMEARPTQPQGMYWGEYYVSNLTMDVRNELSTVWADAVDTIRNPPKSSQVVQSKQWARELSDAVNRYWEDPSGGVDRYAVYLDEDGSGDLLRIATNFGVFLYAPSVENVISPNAFGYQYNLDEGGWTQNMESGWTEGSVALDLVLWVNTPLSDIGDKYEKVYNGLTWWKEHNVLLGVGTFVFVALGVWMLVYLCLAAGYSRKSEEVRLNWFHRISGEFILAGVILLGCYPVSWLVEGIVFYIPYSGMHIGIQMAMAGCGMAALSVLAIVLLMTVSARVKSHTLLTNTLLWRLCSWAWSMWLRMRRAIPLVWRVAMGGCVYMLLSMGLLLNDAVLLWLVLSVALVVYLCSWAHCWKQIRRSTSELLKGNLDVQISCRKMPHDLQEHAQQLNNLGKSISEAVAEQMRSEHFKAELITNVSHDLKTPLTSIINYVDLLKKEPIPNERVEEYLNILERKSNRLKKLTEDLVEASKASTGVLSVELGRLDMAEMADQALGEYEERLQAAGLSVVRTLPDHPVWVWADGRRLWRVLDNLLSNCAKYALEGSRVYLDLHYDDKYATLALKNISREALNVPVERLMERFVRGDESRSTDGSGLGLSIAQSMTELQHGTFAVEIDGDLFKAMVTLPLVPSEELAEIKG
ncbi:HAMP domain-containing sensor histidine kinase [Pseudoflavonifractor sp. An85]|uniref:sensor histidine kinase n=1 Tax=Pseudoflavonifractor sp. An85 TaxID=1965661 RepID=UPI000B377AB2|nr:HAMP domain-containing sensor histidine kinase [Pseudoflavonifractor sp. An85]OUN20072.1 hypothetical protein B5G37_12985 [Pseudoflavonifractor sp. An85]